MKTKYQRMSKEEKKLLLKRYKNTEKGKYIMSKIRNVFIYGILSYVFAVYLLIDAKNIWSYIGAFGLLIFGSVFIVASIRLYIKNLTRFAVKGK